MRLRLVPAMHGCRLDQLLNELSGKLLGGWRLDRQEFSERSTIFLVDRCLKVLPDLRPGTRDDCLYSRVTLGSLQHEEIALPPELPDQVRPVVEAPLGSRS